MGRKVALSPRRRYTVARDLDTWLSGKAAAELQALLVEHGVTTGADVSMASNHPNYCTPRAAPD